VDGSPALQLACDQGGLGALNGASGAPVIFEDGKVGGVIRYGVLKQRVVFATPIASVLALLPKDAIIDNRSAGHQLGTPLAEIPGQAPRVPYEYITHAIVEGFADFYGTSRKASLLINRAVRLRQEANPSDPKCTWTRHNELPDIRTVGAMDFWQAVLFDACLHGRRMVGAYLIAEPGSRFSTAARTDMERLWDYLIH
jgi:hypothetical protein